MDKEGNDVDIIQQITKECTQVILSIEMHLIDAILERIGCSKEGCFNGLEHVGNGNAIAVVDQAVVFEIRFGTRHERLK